MSKYIIEIEDTPFMTPFTDLGLYKAKNFKTLVFDEEGLKKLELYEAPPFDSEGRVMKARGNISLYGYVGKKLIKLGELFDSDCEVFAVQKNNEIRFMTRDELWGRNLCDFFNNIMNADIYAMTLKEVFASKTGRTVEDWKEI